MRARGISAHIGSALTLGHAHPNQRGGFLRHRQASRIVLGRKDARQPGFGEPRQFACVPSQDRHCRKRHRQRALRAVLHFRMHEVSGGAHNLSTTRGLGPRRRVLPRTHGESHELMPRRIEYDLVDPIAEAVVRPELRRVPVGARSEVERFRAAQDRAPCR